MKLENIKPILSIGENVLNKIDIKELELIEKVLNESVTSIEEKTKKLLQRYI